MSRLTLDVTDQQHQSLKEMAKKEGKTLNEYAIERLFPVMPEDESTLTDLTLLLRERIAEAERGEIDSRSFNGIFVTTINSKY
jgi:hypothetical protein